YKDLDGDGVLEKSLYEVDANGNPTPGSGDLINLGNMEQHGTYYVNGGLNFKNFDFSFILQGVRKWMVFDQNGRDQSLPWIQSLEHFYNNTWRPDRLDAKYPAFSSTGADFNNAVNNNNYEISNAPYMRQNN